MDNRFGNMVEEGRLALNELERQLKEKRSEKQSHREAQARYAYERRALDHIPRNERLKYIKGSPLGLTLVELDDRGLLNGGGSFRSNSSSTLRGRRPLEMRRRSSRMKDREKDGFGKTLNSFFHMLRSLVKRGLNIEGHCRQYDIKGQGLMDRRSFSSMLRKLGLPFSHREFSDIKERYADLTVPDQIEYDSLLRDAGVYDLMVELSPSLTVSLSPGTESASSTSDNSYCFGSVVTDVKRMILDSMVSLGKTPNDVYRMFTPWDPDGTGAVTATQFLRVLARMHVDLSDSDQDFLVEMLDINEMGKIQYEGILGYCFNEDRRLQEEEDGDTISLISGDNTAGTGPGELRSIVSQNSLARADQYQAGYSLNHSNPLHQSHSRRPHTASAVSPAPLMQHQHAYEVEPYLHDHYHAQGTSYQPTPALGGLHHNGGNRHVDTGVQSDTFVGSRAVGLPPAAVNVSLGRNKPQRPMTAAARVSSINQPTGRSMPPGQGQEPSVSKSRPMSAQFIVEVPDDEENELDENCFQLTPNTAFGTDNGFKLMVESPPAFPVVGQRPKSSSYQEQQRPSVRGNTALGSALQYSKESMSLEGTPTLPAVTMVPPDACHSGNSSVDSEVRRQENENLARVESSSTRGPHSAREQSFNSKITHNASQMSSQKLSLLRELLLEESRGGNEEMLLEIFRHYFDRSNQCYFNSSDLIYAMKEFHIELSLESADLAMDRLMIDGDGPEHQPHVSFGEFATFVLDPNHAALETRIQSYLAEQFIQQGRNFQSWLYNVFWMVNNSGPSSAAANFIEYKKQAESGLVSMSVFSSTLSEIYPIEEDIVRLVRRFNIHGSGHCSVSRFLRMILQSAAWKRAEKIIACQEEAIEEAQTVRRRQQQNLNPLENTGDSYAADMLTPDFISMAEYLGIRLLTEKHLYWIIRAALDAPLPVNWIMEESEENAVCYYYNTVTGQAQWEHPMDSHFCQLRDESRLQQSVSNSTQNSSRLAEGGSEKLLRSGSRISSHSETYIASDGQASTMPLSSHASELGDVAASHGHDPVVTKGEHTAFYPEETRSSSLNRSVKAVVDTRAVIGDAGGPVPERPYRSATTNRSPSPAASSLLPPSPMPRRPRSAMVAAPAEGPETLPIPTHSRPYARSQGVASVNIHGNSGHETAHGTQILSDQSPSEEVPISSHIDNSVNAASPVAFAAGSTNDTKQKKHAEGLSYTQQLNEKRVQMQQQLLDNQQSSHNMLTSSQLGGGGGISMPLLTSTVSSVSNKAVTPVLQKAQKAGGPPLVKSASVVDRVIHMNNVHISAQNGKNPSAPQRQTQRSASAGRHRASNSTVPAQYGKKGSSSTRPSDLRSKQLTAMYDDALLVQLDDRIGTKHGKREDQNRIVFEHQPVVGASARKGKVNTKGPHQ